MINGKMIVDDWKYRKEIGYLPQIARFPENLKVIELSSSSKKYVKKKVIILI